MQNFTNLRKWTHKFEKHRRTIRSFVLSSSSNDLEEQATKDCTRTSTEKKCHRHWNWTIFFSKEEYEESWNGSIEIKRETRKPEREIQKNPSLTQIHQPEKRGFLFLLTIDQTYILDDYFSLPVRRITEDFFSDRRLFSFLRPEYCSERIFSVCFDYVYLQKKPEKKIFERRRKIHVRRVELVFLQPLCCPLLGRRL